MPRFNLHPRLLIQQRLRSILILAAWREKGKEHMDSLSNLDLAANPVTLKVIGIGSDGQPIPLAGRKPVWAFDPADIVQVDLSDDWTEAVLTRKAAGTVTVTVAVDNVHSAPLTVQVQSPELAGLAIQVKADAPATPVAA
jgi:hypothetical protein